MFKPNLLTFRKFSELKQVKVRYAPSPTGAMHLGNLRIALYNYLWSKSKSGQFFLRLEDTDRNRLVSGAISNILLNLNKFGLKTDAQPIYQSQRLPLYEKYADYLISKNMAYHCFCTSERLNLIKSNISDVTKYDGHCSNLSSAIIEENIKSGKPFCIRFKLNPYITAFQDEIYGLLTNKNVTNGAEGDFIIIKSDGYPTYHFANVIDDHEMGITHVIRGSEWISSTTKHLMLYEAFGWTKPKFAHLPLIYTADGAKLSKRRSDLQLEEMLKIYEPMTLLNFITLGTGGFTKVNLSTIGHSLSEEQQSNPKIKNVPLTIYRDLNEMIAKFRGLKYIQNIPIRLNFDMLARINQRILTQKIDEFDKEITIQTTKSRDSHTLTNTQTQYKIFENNELMQKFIGLLNEKSIPIPKSIYNPKQSFSPTKEQSFIDYNYLYRILHWAKLRIHLLQDLLPDSSNPNFHNSQKRPVSYNFLWFDDFRISEAEYKTIHPNTVKITLNIMESSTLLNNNVFERSYIDSYLLHNNSKESILQPITYEALMQQLRYLITGNTMGPSIKELYEVLGRQRFIHRVKLYETESNYANIAI